MFEFAAFGFVYLAWWTWPLMAGIVFGTMWAAMWLDTRKHRREDAAAGPHPCLAFMGTDASGQSDHWCWQREGHAGDHVNQWGVPSSDFTEDDEMSVVGWARQQMTAHRCTAKSTTEGLTCVLDAGHDGPHTAPPELGPERVCLRSSNCYMISDHEGPCQLDYSDDPRQDVVIRDITISGLCTHGEDGAGNPDGCWKPAGHDGPHMIMGSSEEF